MGRRRGGSGLALVDRSMGRRPAGGPCRGPRPLLAGPRAPRVLPTGPARADAVRNGAPVPGSAAAARRHRLRIPPVRDHRSAALRTGRPLHPAPAVRADRFRAHGGPHRGPLGSDPGRSGTPRGRRAPGDRPEPRQVPCDPRAGGVRPGRRSPGSRAREPRARPGDRAPGRDAGRGAVDGRELPAAGDGEDRRLRGRRPRHPGRAGGIRCPSARRLRGRRTRVGREVVPRAGAATRPSTSGGDWSPTAARSPVRRVGSPRGGSGPACDGSPPSG